MSSNELLLNPRLPASDRAPFEKAWRELVEPQFKDHVGISTSGSSGQTLGKIILLSRTALEASAQGVNERFSSGPEDKWFKTLPDFHVGGLGILIRARLSGAQVVQSKLEKWDAREIFTELSASGATLLSLVPTQVFDLVQLGVRAPLTLRAVIVGGGRLEENLRLAAIDLGWPILPSYGMTEACSQVATALSVADPSLRALSHAELRIHEADLDGVGRICVRGPSLLSAQVVFASDGSVQLIDPTIDGWLITEDRGSVSDGVLTVSGRTIDFVKIGGEGVLLSRLEEKFEQTKLSVMFTGDAALLAVHDERLGARIVALATTSAQQQTEHLVETFNMSVLPFERVRETFYVDALPRSDLGKLRRSDALALIGLKAFSDISGN